MLSYCCFFLKKKKIELIELNWRFNSTWETLYFF